MEDIGFKQGFQEQLHDQIRIKYINDKKAILENTRARILEKGFNELLIGLQAQSLNQQGFSPNVGHIAYDLISNYNFPTGLFQAMKINPTQEKQSNFQQGFQFEKDLESLLQTLFSTNVPLAIGDQQVHPGMIFNPQGTNLPGNLKVMVPKQVGQEIQKMTLKHAKEKGIQAVYLAEATGVIDLQTPSSALTLQYNYHASTKMFLQTLRNIRITAKSYTDVTSIASGKTSLYRSISSVLSDLGYGPSIIESVYKYYNQGRKKLNFEDKNHLNHLVYVYQVLGVGQYIDINGVPQRLAETDYLVVYDRKNNVIKVRSTRALALNNLQNKKVFARYPLINLLR